MAFTHGATGYHKQHCRCDVCRRGHADAMRDYIRRKRADRKCVSCSAFVPSGRARCDAHRLQFNAWLRARRTAHPRLLSASSDLEALLRKTHGPNWSRQPINKSGHGTMTKEDTGAHLDSRTPIDTQATAGQNEAAPTFTPGPWRYVDGVVVSEPFDSIVMVEQKDGPPMAHHRGLLALVYGHHVGPEMHYTRDANARLIAAAPDLFDIARTIVAICESGDNNLAQLACTETSPLVDAARAALALVEGTR